MDIRDESFVRGTENESDIQEVRKLTATSTLSSRGQAVIPAEIRKAAGVQEGDRLVWTWENGMIVVHVQRRQKLTSLIGVLPTTREYRDPSDIRKDVYAHMVKRELGREG